MEGKEEKIYRALRQDKKEEKDYPCVWYPKICCPIRSRWKLSPENLTPWCTACKQIGYLDEQKAKLRKEPGE